MNPQLQYLNRLASINAITNEDYINRLGLAYRNNPASFNEDDVDFIEKAFKQSGLEFNRDMKASEANLGSTLNQFVSGLVEGFTTLGWADDPTTTTESIANKVGHLVGLAPDVIMGVLSMGAAVPGLVGKRAAAKGAAKVAKKAGATQEQIVKASEAYQAALSKTAAKLKVGNFNLAKNIEGKMYLRSVPMKIADVVIENMKLAAGKNNLLTSGFLSKGLLGSKRFREVAEQGLHLGVGLGVSAWKEGPKGMAETAMHGAVAGAVFGGVAQYVDIAKLLSNPATVKLGKDAVKNTVNKMSMEQMQAINVALRGTIGSAYTGISAQQADLPLPEVVYEYLLGFFFGASGTRKGEIQRRTLLFDKNGNSKIKSLDNLEIVDKEVKKTQEYKDLEPQDKVWWENYKETLYDQQVTLIKQKKDNAAIKILQNVEQFEGKFNKETLKEFNKKQMELEEVKNSGLNQEEVETLVQDSVELNKEIAKEKEALQKNILDDQFNINLSETEVLKAKIVEKDITDTIELSSAYNEIVDIIQQSNPSLLRSEVQQLLRKSVSKSNYDIEAFTNEIDTVFGKGTMENNGPLIKRYFYRRKYHANHKELMIIDEYNNPVPIGPEGIEIAKNGDNVVTPQSPNKVNKMFGGVVRKTIQYLEKQIFRWNYETQQVEPTGRYTLDNPLAIQFGKAKLGKGEEKTIASGIDTILESINKKLGDNWYIQGANKDSGTLIAHQHGVKKGQVKEVLDVAKNFGIKPEKGFDRETASNIIWDLRRNGLLEKDFTKQDLETAMEVFVDPNNGFTTDLVKWNKYQPLAQGLDLPLEAKDFKNMLSDVVEGTKGQMDGFFNMITANDGAISQEIKKQFPKFDSDTATDGVLYFRNDVMDTILKTFGFDTNIGFVKPVGFIRPRNGKGNILLKVGGFRPSEKLNQYMVDNNIHMIAFKSGVKTQGNVKFSDLDYNPTTKQWGTTETPEVLKVRPDEIGINVDVYEKIQSGNVKVMKGVFDKNTSVQFSPEYWRVIDNLRSQAKRGDTAVNELVNSSIKDKTTIADLDIDKVSIKLIDYVLANHLDKPIAKQLLTEIFNRGRSEDYRVFESYEIDSAQDFIRTGLITDLLQKSGTAFTFISNPRFQPYIQKTIRNYMAARVVRFNVEHGFKAKLYGYDREIYFENKISNNEFMLSEGHKNDLIRVEGQDKPMTLDAAWREFQRLQKYKPSVLSEKDLQRYDALEEALTYLVARAPISGNGGVRVLRFNGFVNRKGYGLFTNEYNDYYLGGADKDADAIHAYQSIDKTIKKEFGKPEIQKELELQNEFINIKDKQIGKDIYGVETGEAYTLSDLFNPRKRLEVGYNAHQGKIQMGEIVNSGVNMITLHDLAMQNKGRINLGKNMKDIAYAMAGKTMTKEESLLFKSRFSSYDLVPKTTLNELVRDVYNGINWMADSAEISKVSAAEQALTKLVSKHFRLIDKQTGKEREIPSWYDMKGYEGYAAFKSFRDSLFGYKASAELADISSRANTFIQWFGSPEGHRRGFLEGLAHQYKDISLQIDPFKYYNKKDVATMVRKMTLNIASDYGSLIKELGMINTMRLMYSPKEFEKMYEHDAWVYNKAQEIVGINLALKEASSMIETFVRAGLSQEKATAIVRDIAQKTYEIKQGTYESTKQLKDKATNNINKFIFLHKQEIASAIRSLGQGKQLTRKFTNDLNRLYDYFLLANPAYESSAYKGEMKYAETNLKELKKDIEEANTLVELLGNQQTNQKLEQLYNRINSKMMRYSGRLGNLNQSPLIAGSSIKSFYREMDALFEKSKQIKSDETPAMIEQAKLTKEIIEKDTVSKANDIEETIEAFTEALPTVSGVKIDIEKTRADILTQKEINPIDLEFLNTLEIIKSRPGYVDYIGNMFLEFQQDFLSKPGKVNEIELTDLKLFNKYLTDLIGAEGSIFDKISKSKKKDGPKGKHHMMFFGQAEKAMRNDIQTRVKEVMVTDKNGNVVKAGLAVPTTTLTKNLEAARFFHRLDNRLKVVIQQRMQEEFKFLNKDDANIQRGDFDAIFNAVVFSKQMRLYDIESIIKDKGVDSLNNAEQYVYSEYQKSQQVLKKLTDDKTIYKLIDKDVQGKFKDVTPQELFNRIDESVTTLLTTVKNDIIASKHPLIKDILLKENKKINQYQPVTTLTKGERGYEVQELNKLLLDKNGFMSDLTKVDVLYKQLLKTEIIDPLNIVNKMFSLTDARYIEYQKGINRMLQEKFPELDFDKELTKPKDIKKAQEYKRELEELFPFEDKISIGRFENENGLVTDYFPQLGHYNIKANIPKLKEWIENNINSYAENIKSYKQLPANLIRQVETGLLQFLEAKEIAIKNKRQMIDRMRITGLSGDLAASEASNAAILSTRPQNWLQQTAGNLKSRSSDFMPFYDTSINALDMYMGAVYRNYIDVIRNIRVDNNIRRFEKEKPFGEFTENWAMYMRDAHNNIAGYPSLRNFDLHGIKEKEVKIIERYIESDLDFVAMKATPYEKRFLQDMQEQLGLTTVQQVEILKEIQKPGRDQDGPTLTKEALKNNYRELLKSKNINKINRFGTAYQAFSDEAIVNVAEKFNDVFGGNLFKDAPKEGRARRLYLANKFKNFSTLEGKFEMLSLLSHPKTAITNFYGGFTNTISDTGWESFRKATSTSWLLSNAFPNAKYFSVDAKGNRVPVEIKSRQDIHRFLSELGVFEDMFIQEAFYSSRLSRINSKRFLNEVARRLNGRIKDGSLTLDNEANYNKVQNQTLREVAKEFGIADRLVSGGAFFMKQSEVLLRTTTWLANYIQGRKLFVEEMGVDLAFNDPVLINYANKGVKASQFIYHAAERPNFSNTSLGRVMTRFHPYAWNSIKRRLDIYKGATYEGWKGGLSTQRAQRQFTADLMALALANIFVASIFEYALSPPMSWMQDTASLIFGDEKARDRAFFSQYPIPALAPLSIVTPPIGRFVLSPLTSIINGNWEDFYNYQLYTYFPFGRLARDASRTAKSPAMFVDFMTGIPQHQIHSYTREMLENWKPDEEMDEVEE